MVISERFLSCGNRRVNRPTICFKGIDGEFRKIAEIAPGAGDSDFTLWPQPAFVTVVLRDEAGGVAIAHIVFTPCVTC